MSTVTGRNSNPVGNNKWTGLNYVKTFTIGLLLDRDEIINQSSRDGRKRVAGRAIALMFCNTIGTKDSRSS